MFSDIEIRFVVIACGFDGESQLSKPVCRIFNVEYWSLRIASNTVVLEHSDNKAVNNTRKPVEIDRLTRTSHPYEHRHPPLAAKPEESLHL